jgi:YD repeat-containing protein
VYGHGLVAKITPSGQRYAYHADSRGSTVAISDPARNIVQAYAYDEYGGTANSLSSFANPFKYVLQGHSSPQRSPCRLSFTILPNKVCTHMSQSTRTFAATTRTAMPLAN